eukprot:363243-Chlamydomonas_euryale.AAC.5
MDVPRETFAEQPALQITNTTPTVSACLTTCGQAQGDHLPNFSLGLSLRTFGTKETKPLAIRNQWAPQRPSVDSTPRTSNP